MPEGAGRAEQPPPHAEARGEAEPRSTHHRPAAFEAEPRSAPHDEEDGCRDRGIGLIPLFCWLSPAFPVGAYAYSHALEWAAEAGDVRDEATLSDWLGDLFVHGFGRNDAIVLACAYRAASADDMPGLLAVNELALALAPSAELRLETSQQGRSFLDATLAAWPHPALTEMRQHASDPPAEIAYPVALGSAAAAHGIDLRETLRGFLAALAGNLVSAAIRLAPIGQIAGQRILAGLAPRLARLAGDVHGLGPDDIGSATFRADLGSLRHETQYTRLFRS